VVYVADAAPDIGESLVQVVDVPVYHWYEYGGVPPDAADVNVSYWPLSIIEFEIVGFPAASALFTVGCTVAEYACADKLSVTL
jgi:hypothetical protein